MKNYAEKIYVLVHHCHEQCLKLMHTKKPIDDNKFNEVGLSTRQGIILKLLLDKDGMTQKELTKHLEITSSSCGELIDKLEQKNYLKRHKNENDKRTYNVYLTESGRVLGEQYKERSIVLLEEWASDLTQEEKKQLYTLLGKLNKGLDKQLKNEHID